MGFVPTAVVGMQLFARIALHEDMPINSNANFRTLGQVGPCRETGMLEGMALGDARSHPPHPHPGSLLPHGHSPCPRTLWCGAQALSLLLRTATGENWQLVMAGCILEPPLCDPDDPQGSTCGTPAAIPYFVSFVCLCTFLIVNLFVAVIVDNFDYLTLERAVLCEHGMREPPRGTAAPTVAPKPHQRLNDCNVENRDLQELI